MVNQLLLTEPLGLEGEARDGGEEIRKTLFLVAVTEMESSGMEGCGAMVNDWVSSAGGGV